MSFQLETFLLQMIQIFFWVAVIFILVKLFSGLRKQEQRLKQLETDLVHIKETMSKHH